MALHNLKLVRRMIGGTWYLHEFTGELHGTWGTFWSRSANYHKRYERIIKTEKYKNMSKIPLTVAFNATIARNKEVHGSGFDTNELSDGYHTFGELYEHRITLFITLCRILFNSTYGEDKKDISIWKTPPIDGWFIMGITVDGKQITYHLPESKWNETEFCEYMNPKSYQFDGHNSDDVLQRLKTL